MPIEQSQLVERATQLINERQPNWVEILCLAGLLYRYQQDHPLLTTITNCLIEKNVDLKSCFEQMQISKAFENFHAEPIQNVQDFDRYCAAAHWLDAGHIFQNYTDMFIFSMQVDPEPWFLLVDEAEKIMLNVPPLEGDPARSLWISINSLHLIPQYDSPDSIQPIEAEEEKVVPIKLLLPKTTRRSRNETIEIWKSQYDFVYITLSKEKQDLIIEQLTETTPTPIVYKNGSQQKGVQKQKKTMYQAASGSWEIHFEKDRIAFDIQESRLSVDYCRLFEDLLSANTMLSDRAYDKLLFDKDPQAIVALIETYQNSPRDETLRYLCIQLLGFKQAPQSLECLLQALQDPSVSVRREACLSLEELASKEALEPIKQLFTDPNPDVRKTAKESYRVLKSKK